MYYTVYRHITPNGKTYVGITGKKPEKRWNNGNGYKNNKHFYRAIVKYGWENITHEIVESGLTKEQACDLEIKLIAKYDSTNPDKGYNHSTGGECSSLGMHQSAETRRKIGEANKGANSPNYGKHLSADTRRKISESLKGANSPWYGKHLNAETRQKLSESNQGIIPPYIKPSKVMCIETGEVFQQVKDAREKYGIASSNISKVCRHKRDTAGGYHWKYAENMEESK